MEREQNPDQNMHSDNARRAHGSASQAELQAQILTPLLGDLFQVDAIYPHDGKWVVSLTYRYERAKSVKHLKERLRLAGYRFTLVENPDGPLLLTMDPKRHLHIPPLNVMLFVATLLSVYVVPLYIRFGTWEATKAAMARGEGVVFALAITSILLVHEMGHFVASRRRHIATSWPYFLPAPNLFGTFGAVIKSRSPFWNRRDLMEVGAAGPIFGWIVAIGWLAIGFAQTKIVMVSNLQLGDLAWSLTGESILFRFLALLQVGAAPDGYTYVLSEAAFAGWAGLLVTAINLLPIGQLDGGHITYSLVRRRQAILGWFAVVCLALLGFQSMMWWLFAALGMVFGVAHPPTIQDEKPLTRTARWMGVIALIILLLSFTPVPIQT